MTDKGTWCSVGMEDNFNVSYLAWGIFHIAYDSTTPTRTFLLLTDPWAYCKPSRMFFKFLEELWYLDRWHSSLFYLCTLWIAVAPAFSLYFAHIIISSARFSVPLADSGHLLIVYQAEDIGKNQLNDKVKDFQIVIFVWILCGFLSHQADRTK